MYTALWTCLDKSGHDACRISRIADGWSIEGTAVFCHQGDVASLSYCLVCDDRWCSQSALVKGWVGGKNIEISISQEPGRGWSINGLHDEAFEGLLDIDLGFTPASNTNALRRLNLTESQTASSIAVWLDTEDWKVKKLPQEYARTSPNAYDYSSPMHGYQATLRTTDFGIVSEYPGLWRMLNHIDGG